jgi:hypothetical protein
LTLKGSASAFGYLEASQQSKKSSNRNSYNAKQIQELQIQKNASINFTKDVLSTSRFSEIKTDVMRESQFEDLLDKPLQSLNK